MNQISFCCLNRLCLAPRKIPRKEKQMAKKIIFLCLDHMEKGKEILSKEGENVKRFSSKFSPKNLRKRWGNYEESAFLNLFFSFIDNQTKRKLLQFFLIFFFFQFSSPQAFRESNIVIKFNCFELGQNLYKECANKGWLSILP